MPRRFILIRHGESESNVICDDLEAKMEQAERTKSDLTREFVKAHSAKHDSQWLLTEKGKEQARLAGFRLKEIIGDEPAVFFVSPYYRTRMTCEGILAALSGNNVRYHEDPRLREQEIGNRITGQAVESKERDHDHAGTFYYRFPDGESMGDVCLRVANFLDEVTREVEWNFNLQRNLFLRPRRCIAADANMVIVSHGYCMKAMLMRWFALTIEQFDGLKTPQNCEIVVMSRQGDGTYKLTDSIRCKVKLPSYMFTSEGVAKQALAQGSSGTYAAQYFGQALPTENGMPISMTMARSNSLVVARGRCFSFVDALSRFVVSLCSPKA